MSTATPVSGMRRVARHAALYEVSVHQRLGDPAAAVGAARGIDTKGLSGERTARLYIDVARSYADWGRPRQCYAALLGAEQAAPQEVRRDVVVSSHGTYSATTSRA
jgi:hypothetical protein